MTGAHPTIRERIVQATEALLADEGMAGVNVSAIMRRAGISRTAFYRQFDDVYGVIATVLERLVQQLLDASGDWFRGETGTPEIVRGNLLSFARVFEEHGRTLEAIRTAGALDDRIGSMWRSLVDAFRDATAAAIRRDQAVGAIDRDLDPAAAAKALTWMGEQASIDLLGRRAGGDGTGAEAYADLLAPVWSRTLFGIRETAQAGSDTVSRPG